MTHDAYNKQKILSRVALRLPQDNLVPSHPRSSIVSRTRSSIDTSHVDTPVFASGALWADDTHSNGHRLSACEQWGRIGHKVRTS